MINHKATKKTKWFDKNAKQDRRETHGVLYMNSEQRLTENRFSVIVLGTPQGGTTMIARVLHALGVFIGNDLQAVYEDPEIIQAFADYYRDQCYDMTSLQTLIASRNEQYDVWGWKYPTQPWPELYELHNAPRYLLIQRDVAAIAARRAARMPAAPTNMLGSIMTLQQQLIDFAVECGRPVMLASYEKALLKPKELVEQIVDFLLPYQPDEQQIEAAMQVIAPSPDAYFTGRRRYRIEGEFEGIEQGHLVGWVVDREALDQPVHCEMIVDGTSYPMTTQRIRPEIAAKYGCDECCGFAFPIPQEKYDGAFHKVEVRVEGIDQNDMFIKFSPRNIEIPKA